jgi:hypothetical protein
MARSRRPAARVPLALRSSRPDISIQKSCRPGRCVHRPGRGSADPGPASTGCCLDDSRRAADHRDVATPSNRPKGCRQPCELVAAPLPAACTSAGIMWCCSSHSRGLRAEAAWTGQDQAARGGAARAVWELSLVSEPPFTRAMPMRVDEILRRYGPPAMKSDSWARS